MSYKPPYAGAFGNMEFPPYRFQEYPKVIGKDAQNRDIIALTQSEELAYIARGEVTATKADSLEADRNLAVATAAELQRQNDELQAKLAAMEERLREMSKVPDLLDGLTPKKKV